MSRLSSFKRKSVLALFVSLAFNVSAQEPTLRYSGVVYDDKGQPIKNARVHIHGRQQYVYVDDNGRFSIQAPANAELHIAAAGYGDSFVKVTPTNPNISVNLTQGGVERIVVSASGIHQYHLEMVTPVSVLSGEALSNKLQPTIGETLKFEPGVHANYFGPVASSPIIRGLDGPRVKILNNGLDTADVSRVGPDHAISADALTAEQIEVLRGPATLLYGSGAIGGVVNVVDNRIPRQLRSESETKVEARYTSVADEKNLAFNHEGNGDTLAWHLDGFTRKGEDYDTPRFINSEGESSKRIENTWVDTKSANVGVSYIGQHALVGVSVGALRSDYGIPGHSHEAHEHTHEQHAHAEHSHEPHSDNVYASLKQNRISGAVEWFSPISGIETLSLNTAYTDYKHQEIEGASVGTTFENKAFESRLSLEHEALNNWHGLIGYHLQQNDYKAIGEEAFTPNSSTLSHALFALEEKKFNNLSVQLGARIERTTHEADAIAHSHHEHGAKSMQDSFTSVSASGGVVWEFVPGFSWALALSRSERAPSASELYANGAHMATSSYELGLNYHLHDDEIEAAHHKAKKETANNIDVTFRGFKGDVSFTYNFFYNKINNYIYLANTGLHMDDLHHEHSEHEEHHHENHNNFSVYQYQQHDATLYGLEFEAKVKIDNHQAVNVFFDAVRARLDNSTYLPRIPPYKTGLGYEYAGTNWAVSLDATHYAKQTKLALNEQATEAYLLVDANVNYDFALANTDLTAFMRLNNLTNELGFVHSSFIKNAAPLPGRSVTVGLRATF